MAIGVRANNNIYIVYMRASTVEGVAYLSIYIYCMETCFDMACNQSSGIHIPIKLATKLHDALLSSP